MHPAAMPFRRGRLFRLEGSSVFFLYSADAVVLCVYSSSYLRMSPGTQFSSEMIIHLNRLLWLW